MANAYSYDLRQKVIEAIELDGLKKSEASEIFHLSRNTIDQWLKRKAATGDYRAKVYQPSGGTAKISDWTAFRSFAYAHQDKTQAEMAALWPEPISQRTISRGLKKIGFTRKKRLMATVSGTRRNELSSRPR